MLDKNAQVIDKLNLSTGRQSNEYPKLCLKKQEKYNNVSSEKCHFIVVKRQCIT